MQPQRCIFLSFISLFVIASPLAFFTVSGYGSTGTIAAAFGENGFFCAIDAGGEQAVICWDTEDNNESLNQTPGVVSGYIPQMASLSGGEGFLCGITSNSSRAFCWNLLNPAKNLVPRAFQYHSYFQIAAGNSHVCAICGLYDSGPDFGPVHCWEYGREVGGKNSSFHDPYIDSLMFTKIVSGDGFSCGVTKNSDFVCWGPKSDSLGISAKSVDEYEILASSRNSICGVTSSGQLKCLGDNADFGVLPDLHRYIALSAGASHYCGIREDDHGVECWGRNITSSVPNSSGFVAISSSDYTTCGVREYDLVLDCWGARDPSKPGNNPPLELCSPGLCSHRSCDTGWFAFNASILNEPEITSLCLIHDLKICLRCGTDCFEGYFLSSSCSSDADRVCTPCSLCQNSSCRDICDFPSPSTAKHPDQHEANEIHKMVIIIGCSVLGFLMFLMGLSLIPKMIKGKTEYDDEERSKMTCCFCLDKAVVEADTETVTQLAIPAAVSLGETKIFRLAELKDATHGFKEFNELGRGSFGFVYKAVLSDGRQVAVKRANAATIIHTNSRDFEAELEILCKIRHNNIVNLLGYCAEMGERLLVYEYMPNGTLHDHLHGDLSPLDWSTRLKISLQIARGLEYLHNEVDPPIVHRDVKTLNILLDAEMCARIADFGLLCSNERDSSNGDAEVDVYDFGIVLLEILSGRKAFDRDVDPPEIAEWAVPLIRKGKAAAIIDRNIALPRNVEPLLKLADLAELALRENTNERPTMRTLVSFLDLNAKNGLTF